MAWWQWSRTASSNATADPSIGFSEGMSPSSVNDSCRAVMARAAEERDDTSGLLVTSGTATAYTVATYQVLNTPTPTDGQLISVTMSATNGLDPMLAADGGTAYPIQSSAGVAVAPGVLISGSPYAFKFSVANSAWMLRNFFGSPFTIPLGGLVPFIGTVVPNSNFAFPTGQAISRTTYAALFALIGTTYGVGDGVTTFNIPDLRERVAAFLGTMGGASSPGRITTAASGIDGTTLGANGGNQVATILRTDLPNATIAIPAGQGSHVHANSKPVAFGATATGPGPVPNVLPAGNTDAATLPAMATESMNGGVTQTNVNKMPPTIMLTALLRIF